MSTKPIAGDYNPIFEKLVDGDHDPESELVGIIAYGLYKQAKREWAADIRDDKQRGPSREELEAYVASWTSSRVDGLRTEAAEILASFSGYVIENERPNILKDALRGRFWVGVGESVIGAVCFSVFLILLYLFLDYFGLPLPSLGSSALPAAAGEA